MLTKEQCRCRMCKGRGASFCLSMKQDVGKLNFGGANHSGQRCVLNILAVQCITVLFNCVDRLLISLMPTRKLSISAEAVMQHMLAPAGELPGNCCTLTASGTLQRDNAGLLRHSGAAVSAVTHLMQRPTTDVSTQTQRQATPSAPAWPDLSCAHSMLGTHPDSVGTAKHAGTARMLARIDHTTHPLTAYCATQT